MSESKYKYDFPEQKKLKKGLNYSDIPNYENLLSSEKS